MSTSKYVGDAEIVACVRAAEEMLSKLQLSDGERKWAKERATLVFHDVSEALLSSEKPFTELRVLSVPAAIAYALVLARDWADATSKMHEAMKRDKQGSA